MDKKESRTRTLDVIKQEREVSPAVKEELKRFNRMKREIKKALEEGPLTIPELSEKLGLPADEVTFFVMSLRKYGILAAGELDDMDEYYYWIIEVDGMSKEGVEQMLQPRQIKKEDVISIVYQIPAAGYLEIEKDSSVSTLILKSRHLFLDILEDVKHRGYLIAPAKHTSGTLWQRRTSENAYQIRLIQNKQRREKLERELRRAGKIL